MRASDDATGADIAPQGLQVLHADDHLLAFDKPSGLLSVPGRGADKQDCLASRVQARWPDARVVHRLDQATSGVILLARGLEMQRRLSACFADRRIDKRYIALVDGWLDADAGTVDLPLQADWSNRPKQHVDHAGGKPALTGWQVLSRRQSGDGRPYARLALVPATGRTHQLRVHLQAIGHPILGDALYAPPRVAACAPRLLLHAETLAFDHPATGTRLEIAAAAPF